MAAASRGAAGSPAPPPPSGTSLGAATASVAAAGGFNVDLALQAQRDALSLERRQDVLEDGLGLGSALRPYALASDHVYLLCSADEVTRWLIDHVAAPLAEGAGGYT